MPVSTTSQKMYLAPFKEISSPTKTGHDKTKNKALDLFVTIDQKIK